MFAASAALGASRPPPVRSCSSGSGHLGAGVLPGISPSVSGGSASNNNWPSGGSHAGTGGGGAPLTIGHVHAVLEVRSVLQALLGAIGAIARVDGDADEPELGSGPSPAHGLALRRALAELVQTARGFFDDEAYAAERVHALGLQRELLVLLTKLHLAVSLAPDRAKPAGREANRRLKTFVNSLWMHFPPAPSIAAMQSWSIITPVYSESILYSQAELLTRLSDGRSLLDVLKQLYAQEWAHFLQRIGVHVSTDPSEYHICWADVQLARQVRLWASMRGQTLTRTMVGMMQYERALALISRVECPSEAMSPAEAGATIGAKFSLVIAAQLYAQFKAEGDPRAADIEWLLLRFPTLRIAFVSPARELSRPGVRPTLFATLARVDPESGALVTDATVALPGNPFLGEGKPENQNIALPFALGEKVQLVDMNQEGYLEEALKMRSLLAEFELTLAGQPPRTVVGFTEHIFTEASGFVTAVYMALQERYFCAFHQRVADVPLDVRMHYGHPDVLDKLHFLQRGGIARSSKAVNLNEDIFAAYNTMLRGGSVVFREYISVGKGRMTNLSEICAFEVKLAQGAAEQCMSRDVYRLTRALMLPRLMSFYYSGLGFYIHQVLMMRVTLMIGYLLALLALLKLDGSVMPHQGQIGLMAALPVLVTLATIVPAALMVLAQRGPRAALAYAYMILTTLAPVYYIFITQTRAHFFAHTIRFGGAKYVVANRAVSTTHVPLHEVFGAYARSHFYPACDVLIALAVGRVHTSAPLAFSGATWMIWTIGACWLVAPFLYNLQAVEARVVADDAKALLRWLRAPAGREPLSGKARGPTDSWEVWWAQAY
ncbi:1,3-beta-glucan synthase component-domain-containing protein, partial [Pavlovales sp. CCMP2436]